MVSRHSEFSSSPADWHQLLDCCWGWLCASRLIDTKTMRDERKALWRRSYREVVGCVGRVRWWQGKSIPVLGPAHTGTLHLLGGSNFDPPGSMRHWCSLLSPKLSAGETRRRGLLTRRTNGSSNELDRAYAKSGMRSRWWSCTTWKLGAARC